MKIRIQPGLDHITDRADLLRGFIAFVCNDLGCTPCDIDIVNGREQSGLKTTAQYDPNNHHVMVNAKNRHFGDVLRSIAHELVHHKQNLKGELNAPVQDVGGDIEDEANARAGALLKSFAYRQGPERIYEQVSEEAKEARQALESQLRTFLGKVGTLPAGGRDAMPDGQKKENIKAFPAQKGQGRLLANLLRDNPVPEFEKDPIEAVAGMGAPNLSGKATKRYSFKGRGVAVQAIHTGVVAQIGSNQKRGNFVQILHRFDKPDGSHDVYASFYEHLAELTPEVKVGQPIDQRIIIGYTGKEAEKGNEENEFLNDDLFEIEVSFRKSYDKEEKRQPGKRRAVDPATLKEDSEIPPLAKVIHEQTDDLASLKKQFLKTFTVRKPLDVLRVTGGFGTDKEARGYIHKGIDYGATPAGTSGQNPVYNSVLGRVVATRSGVPDAVYKNFKDIRDNCEAHKQRKAGGNLVKIEAIYRLPGDKKLIVFYAHLFDGSIKVKKGDLVKPGQQIGLLGASGCTTGAHLHLEMRLGKGKKEFIKSYEELQEATTNLKASFSDVIDDDVKFLSLFEKTVPEAYRKPKLASESLESHATIKNYINEIVSAYGTGRLDPMGGGIGRMFKMGVDYKNASTNVPRAAAGYVDRTHPMPYEITIKTDRDPRELFNTMFQNDFETELIVIVPDQVHYGKDGLKMQSHVSTSRNKADSRDVKLVQDELYSSILGLPSTPKDAQFVIDVKPVTSKIRR